MIWNIPIEPYEERYTEQWYRWFHNSFDKLGLEYRTIDGDTMTDKVEVGSVLDVYGTHYYKFSQLQLLMASLRANEIKDDDILFFHDLWFPGIEALAYVRNMTGIKFKIWGVLHAGTWDNKDFTFLSGMRPWAKHIENGWLKLFDRVYLGSIHHKFLIANNNQTYEDVDELWNKLFVTGLPFDYQEARRVNLSPKENIVVFPHRLNKEKRPDLFDQLKDTLSAKYPNWQFIKTKDVCKTKEEYYQLLGKSKIAVSFAEQETFGYAMLEAIANDCIPIVPNHLSYAEMEIYHIKFETYKPNQVIRLVKNIIRSYETMPADIQYIIGRNSEIIKKYLPKNIIGKWFEEVKKIDSAI